MVETLDIRSSGDPSAGSPGEPGRNTAPGAPPEPPAVLRRSRDDRMVFGVAGGLGRYLGIDPVFVRIAFVLLTVLGGSGVLLYLIGFLVIPEERPGDAVGARPGAVAGPGPAMIIGIGLVAIGTVTLLSRFIPSFSGLLGPLALVGIGLLVLLKGGRR